MNNAARRRTFQRYYHKPMSMTVGSLFSGVGGLDLGFERAGFEIKWMCEKDEWRREKLSERFPGRPIFDDVNELTDPPHADIIIGGFPCQDISTAGAGAGIAGKKSGLWGEMLRVVRTVRPRYVAIENVANLVNRGLRTVLGGLAESGYDAEWQTLSACMFGAPHVRRRMFIVAYPYGVGQLQPERCLPDVGGWTSDGSTAARGRSWPPEPEMDRVAHGLPDRLAQERALGDAVSPPVAEYVARRIRQHAARNA